MKLWVKLRKISLRRFEGGVNCCFGFLVHLTSLFNSEQCHIFTCGPFSFRQ